MKGLRWIAAASTISILLMLLATDGLHAQQPDKKVVRIASARGVDFVALRLRRSTGCASRWLPP